MIRPTFILACAFAISALFVDVSSVAYAAPIPTENSVAYSSPEPRSCSKMGCLYVLPDTDAVNDGNATATAAVSPPADTSSALQVIDLLISAMQSAASDLHESSTAIPEVDSDVLATETSVDAQENAPVVEVIDLSA